MAHLYNSADVLVSPYKMEVSCAQPFVSRRSPTLELSPQGFNLPVLEAGACGTPVVVTKGGPTDDFTDASWAVRVNSTLHQHDDASWYLQVGKANEFPLPCMSPHTRTKQIDEAHLLQQLEWVVWGESSTVGGAVFRQAALRAGPAWVAERGLVWDGVGLRLLSAIESAVAANRASQAKTRRGDAGSTTVVCRIMQAQPLPSDTSITVDVPCAHARFGGRPMPHEVVLGRAVTVQPMNACTPIVKDHALRGAVAVVARGTCGFAEKALRAQSAGAVAVLVINGEDQELGVIGSNAKAASLVRIPVVLVASRCLRDGEDFGSTVTALRDDASRSLVVMGMAPKHRAAQYLTSRADQLAATSQQAAAARHFAQAVAMSPLMLPRAHLGMAWIHMERVAWHGYDAALAALHRSLELFGSADACRFIQPAMQVPTAVLSRVCGSHWRSHRLAAPRSSTVRGISGRRLRVGFISSSLGPHPLGQLVDGLFEELTLRGRVDVLCYNTASKTVDAARRVGCHSVVDLAMPSGRRRASSTDGIDPLLLREAVKTIGRDQLHVLVDLDAVTGTHFHVAVVAQLPAMVVMHYLGQPLRHAADPGLDFFVADARIVEAERCHHEPVAELMPLDRPHEVSQRVSGDPGLLLLPRSFYLDASQHLGAIVTAGSTASLQYARRAAGLPTDSSRPVLCAFNQLKKVDPTAWRVWMQVLSRVPEATLWLSGYHGGTARGQAEQAARVKEVRPPHTLRENVQLEMGGHGRSQDQIVFANWTSSRKAHLERLSSNSDVFLDTLHFTAGSVAVDALRGGVPVVTCPRETSSSRQAFRYVIAV